MIFYWGAVAASIWVLTAGFIVNSAPLILAGFVCLLYLIGVWVWSAHRPDPRPGYISASRPRVGHDNKRRAI